MPTNILDYTTINVTDVNKHEIINTIFQEIEASLHNPLELNLSSDVTLTNTQYKRNSFFNCTPVSGSRNFTVPNTQRVFFVKNSGTGSVNVKRSLGTSILLNPGISALILNTGEELVNLFNNSLSSFLSLSDTPNSYSGAANDILRVNSTANSIEFGILDNMTATTNPTNNEDSNDGYSIGSKWLNTLNNSFWICKNASVGNAIWEEFFPKKLVHCGYGSTGNSDTLIVNAVGAVPLVNTLYLYPTKIVSGTTFTSLYSRPLGGGSLDAKCKFAIWENNYTTGLPFGLPVASNNTPLSLATNPGFRTATISFTPKTGIYWLGTVVEGTTIPSFPAINIDNFEIGMLIGAGWLDSQIFKTTPNGMSGISTPLTFSTNISTVNLTGATFTNVTGATNLIPRLGIGW